MDGAESDHSSQWSDVGASDDDDSWVAAALLDRKRALLESQIESRRLEGGWSAVVEALEAESQRQLDESQRRLDDAGHRSLRHLDGADDAEHRAAYSAADRRADRVAAAAVVAPLRGSQEVLSVEGRAAASPCAAPEVSALLADMLDTVVEGCLASEREDRLARESFCGALNNSAAVLIQHVLRAPRSTVTAVAVRRFAAVRRFFAAEGEEAHSGLAAADEVNATVAAETDAEAQRLRALGEALRLEVEESRRHQRATAAAAAAVDAAAVGAPLAVSAAVVPTAARSVAAGIGPAVADAVTGGAPAGPPAGDRPAADVPSAALSPSVARGRRQTFAAVALAVALADCWCAKRLARSKCAATAREDFERSSMARCDAEAQREAVFQRRLDEKLAREREHMLSEDAAAQRYREARRRHARQFFARRAAAQRDLEALVRSRLASKRAADLDTAVMQAAAVAASSAPLAAAASLEAYRAASAANAAANLFFAFLDAEEKTLEAALARDRQFAAEAAASAAAHLASVAAAESRDRDTAAAERLRWRKAPFEDCRRDRAVTFEGDRSARETTLRRLAGALPAEQRLAAVHPGARALSAALFASGPGRTPEVEPELTAASKNAPTDASAKPAKQPPKNFGGAVVARTAARPAPREATEARFQSSFSDRVHAAPAATESTLRRLSSDAWVAALARDQQSPAAAPSGSLLSRGPSSREDEGLSSRGGEVWCELSADTIIGAGGGEAFETHEAVSLDLSLEGLGGSLAALKECVDLRALSLNANFLDGRLSMNGLGAAADAAQMPLRWLSLADNALRGNDLQPLFSATNRIGATLATLIVDGNRFESLSALQRCAQLRCIRASRNRLSNLCFSDGSSDSETLAIHTTLERFVADGNFLGPYFRLARRAVVFEALTDLDISRNGIEMIDCACLTLAAPCLERLVASHNALRQPPHPLALKLLRNLWLNGNAIHSLEAWRPPNVASGAAPGSDHGGTDTDADAHHMRTWLPSLVELRVAHNGLRAAFGGLGSLASIAPRLRTLDVSHNALPSLQDVAALLRGLSNLTSLAVRGNPAFDDSMLAASPGAVGARLRAFVTVWLVTSGDSTTHLDAPVDTPAERAAALLAVALAQPPLQLRDLDGEALPPRSALMLAQLRHGLCGEDGGSPTQRLARDMVDFQGPRVVARFSTDTLHASPHLSAFARLFPRGCDGCGARLAVSRRLLAAVRAEEENGDSAPALGNDTRHGDAVTCKKCATEFNLPPWPAARTWRVKPGDGGVLQDAAHATTQALLRSVGAFFRDDGARLLQRGDGDVADARGPHDAAAVGAAAVGEISTGAKRRLLALNDVAATLGRFVPRRRGVVAAQSRVRSRECRRRRAADRGSSEDAPKDYASSSDDLQKKVTEVTKVQGLCRSRLLRRRLTKALAAAAYVDAEVDDMLQGDLDLAFLDNSSEAAEARDAFPDAARDRWVARRAEIDAVEAPRDEDDYVLLSSARSALTRGPASARGLASAPSTARSEADTSRMDVRRSHSAQEDAARRHPPRTTESDVSSLSQASHSQNAHPPPRRLLPDIFSDAGQRPGGGRHKAHRPSASKIFSSRPPPAAQPTSIVSRDRASHLRQRKGKAKPAWATARDGEDGP